MTSAILTVKAHTLPELLDICANEYKDEIFLLAHDSSYNPQSISFSQFHQKVIQTALHLRKAGLSKGSRCAFLFDVGESAITAIFAALSLGAVVVLVNRQIPGHILSQLFKSCEVTFLYLERGTEEEYRLTRENNITIIDAGAPVLNGHTTTPNSVVQLEKVLPSDPAVIMFTSGTTSTPKGVLHSHSNLLYAVESKRSTLEAFFVPGGTVLGILPLFHVMGFTNTLLYCLYTGLRYALFQSPITPDLYALAVKRVKPFTFDTVPWILEHLVAMCKTDHELLSQLQALKLISFGGGMMQPHVADFYVNNKIPIAVNWGQTEIGGAAFYGGLTPDAPEPCRLLRPLRGVYPTLEKLVGEHEGLTELVIKDSQTLALGYIVDGKLVPLSREAYRTRDIFGRTETGEYFIQARIDSIIVHANGEKTNPIPFLSLSQVCPLIKHVCVIGHNRTHNVLLVQITEEHLTLQIEQEVWNFVSAANGDLLPHSHVRRHQIIFIPSSSTMLLPISSKGEVLIRQAEVQFADQIEKVYKNSSFLAERYPEGFLERLKQESPFQQKREMSALIKDVLSTILGLDPAQLDMETSFEEQGVRSFEAIQVRNTLSGVLEKLGQLPATVLYDHPTTVVLADWLLQLAGIGEIRVQKHIIGEQKAEQMAIIGVGCRYGGGVKDMKSFWEMLTNCVDAVGLIPRERWDWEKYWDPEGGPGKMTFSEGAFVSDVDQFDPDVFGILPREAHEMDPQHRVLLECTWEAIEHSGYSPESLRGSNTGVFIGMLHHDYVTYVQKDYGDIMTIDTYYGPGNTFSAACGHISYLMDLHGPCLAVDTACSSSMVALQLACQSLQARESDQCIVGGVNFTLSPHTCIFLSKAGMTSPNGRCRAFDAGANGFGRGEGCGVVMVKRLEDAIAHGDRILSVICGVAVNHDGKSNGFTAPSRDAQERVIESALAKSGLEPSSISYLEAHGTGTIIGDNIEMRASGTVLGRGRAKDSPLLVGSVKTNIAHTEAAAGVASIIKTTLCLQHAMVPKLSLFQSLNPNITLDTIPAIIPTSNVAWNTREGLPRYASVNSFGFSGTNAHAILKEHIASEVKVSSPTHHYILPLSACPRTPNALLDMVKQFHTYLSTTKESIDSICYTAQYVRSALRLRTAFVGRTKEELIEALQRYISGKPDEISATRTTATPPKVIAIVAGERSSTTTLVLARSLYASLPTFKEIISDAVAQVLKALPENNLLLDKWLAEGLPTSLNPLETALATFLVEYAVLRVLISWGVVPQIIYARGVGVYAALCVTEILDITEAAAVVVTKRSLPSIKSTPAKTRIVAVDCPAELSKLPIIEQEELEKFVDDATAVFNVTGRDFERVGKNPVLSSPEMCDTAYMSLLAILAHLYIAGVNISWRQLHSTLSIKQMKVDLPFYPFQHQRYWYPPYEKKHFAADSSNMKQLPFLLLKTLYSAKNTFIFEAKLSLNNVDTKFLEEHQVFGNIVFPMTGFIEMALECGKTLLRDELVSVREFVIFEPLLLHSGQNVLLQLIATSSEDSSKFSFEITSKYADKEESTNEWRTHVTGAIAIGESGDNKRVDEPSHENQIQGPAFYDDLVAQGFEYGHHFRCMSTAFVDTHGSIIDVQQKDHVDSSVFHPGLLDACLHAMLLYVNVNYSSKTHIYLPINFEKFTLHEKVTRNLRSQFSPLKAYPPEPETIQGNISIYSDKDVLVGEFRGITVKRTPKVELQAQLKSAKQAHSDIFYKVQWQPSSLTSELDTPQQILIFTDGGEESKLIASHIEATATQTKVVIETFAALQQDNFWESRSPSHVLYIAATNTPISSEVEIFPTQFKSLANAVQLAQKMVSTRFKKLPRLWFITKHATWAGGEEFDLLSSPIWGFVASVILEHPELSCKRVDFDSHQACAELLHQELLRNNNEDQVAFRNGERLVMRFTRTQPLNESFSCDPDASYLVTGGFGGIGIESVDMLIALGARHIVVVSRTGKPTNKKGQQSLDKWIAAGIDVEAHAADMANYNRLKEIITNLKHPLKGILHSAGITDDSSLVNTNWSKFLSVFGTKVFGSWYLHLLTKDVKLDFFVFYSSIAASLGNTGQTNYSAANYFMDALAQYRQKLGLPGLSINWGAWDDVGTAAERNLTAALKKKKGILSFSTGVGIEALQGIMAKSPSDIYTVLWVQWEIYFKMYSYSAVPPLFTDIAKTVQKTNKSTSSVLTKLEKEADFPAAFFDYIKQEIAGIVGIPPENVDPDCALTELGIDSLVATQLRNNLATALSISLPVLLAFDHPSVNLIYQYLLPIVTQKLKEEATTAKKAPEKLIAPANGHAILSTAPEKNTKVHTATTNTFIVPISGLTATAMRNNAEKFKELLQNLASDFASVSYSYLVGQTHFEHRLALVGSHKEIEAEIDEFLSHRKTKSNRGVQHSFTTATDASPKKLAFLFSAETHSNQDKLAKLLTVPDALDKLSEELVGDTTIFKNIITECLPLIPAGALEGELALFAFQYALAKTWQQLGLEPSTCLGSGVGEYTAACITGALSVQDTISILLARREITQNEQSIKRISELVVYLEESAVVALIADTSAKIVSVNGSETVVVAGEASELRKLEFSLRVKNIQFQSISRPRVQSLIPFMSSTSQQQFHKMTENVRVSIPAVSLLPQRSPNFYNTLSPERLSIVATNKEIESGTVVLELNFTSVASANLQRLNHSSVSDVHFVAAYRSIGVNADNQTQILAKLYSLGVPVNWHNYSSGSQKYANATKVVLPNYAQESSAQATARNSVPTLSSVSVPDLSIFSAEAHLLTDTFAPQVLGLVAEALTQYNSAKFSVNIGLSQLSFVEETKWLETDTYALSIKVKTSKKDNSTRFSVFIRKLNEHTWQLYTSGVASEHNGTPNVDNNAAKYSAKIASEISYISSVNTSVDHSQIYAQLTLRVSATMYAYVQELARACADIVQVVYGNSKLVARVVRKSTLQLYSTQSTEVAAHVAVTSKKIGDVNSQIIIQVTFVDISAQAIIATASDVLVELATIGDIDPSCKINK